MVLTDSTSKHTPVAGYEKLPFIAPDRAGASRTSSTCTRWDFAREIQPGVYVHDDYDFERPSVELKTNKALPRGYTPSDYEVYDYPGHLHAEAGRRAVRVGADRRARARSSRSRTASTNARGLAVGSLLTLEDHPREDQNREYLIVGGELRPDVQRLRVAARGRRHRATSARSRRCRRAQQFRPKRHDAEAVRAGSADRGGRRARAARRSTPTSTAG